MKNYKNPTYLIIISFLFLIFFITTLFLFYKVKMQESIWININIDEKKELSFEINSSIYYNIKNSSFIMIDKKFFDGKNDVILKIREIKNIKEDIFNVKLVSGARLNVVPNSTIPAQLIFTTSKNIFNFII
ncbi:MAG1140 family protein [Mesomycoplasma lagogenitalium]|uniref:Uncharacterized protein n=1 Tax=Mesomycoplasma lagogenitalium TaxID=171286 RepID=A0ABY8LX72_9BACT|nr:hypothetical protein [Mesomycoplasma lagogenitalium]WGI36918.1 hypothetical protein QEG99_01390 [Mesomycoplasma lagogenitalium]